MLHQVVFQLITALCLDGAADTAGLREISDCQKAPAVSCPCYPSLPGPRMVPRV